MGRMVTRLRRSEGECASAAAREPLLRRVNPRGKMRGAFVVPWRAGRTVR